MPDDPLLAAAGPLREDYAAVEWAATPLGPVAGWTPALRNALAVALDTRFPVTLFWGPEFVLLYNAAYVDLIADKHPGALGTRAREVFPEAWDAIGPLMAGVLAGDGPTWVEDACVPLRRHGRLDEAYFTFSYSPVRNEDGTIEGVMDIAAETTRSVVDRRRLAVLGRLGEQLGDLEHPGEIATRALPVLRTDPQDLPEVEIRLDGPSGPDRDLLVEETADGRVAWLRFGAGGLAPAPALVVRLSDHLPADAAYLRFLQLISDSLTQALDRIRIRQAERRIAVHERSLSEALQENLLTPPYHPPGLRLAVRYLPAAEGPQVGGDWYDAFPLPDGRVTLVIGDVTGHDGRAAAGMAQARNVLRGVASAVRRPPAQILALLDEALQAFEADFYATAVLAEIEPVPPGGADGGASGRLLRWSNAGHPPPVLVAPDGRATLLETEPETLLGLYAAERTDHALELRPGATLVLYTDGLVERRDASLTKRLRELTEVLDGCHGMPPEAICDLLLERLGAGGGEDDVALLVLQASA